MADLYIQGGFKSQIVDIGTTATKVPGTNMNGRRAMVITSVGSEEARLGAAGVTVAAGYPFPVGKEMTFFISENAQLWAISAGGGAKIAVMEAT